MDKYKVIYVFVLLILELSIVEEKQMAKQTESEILWNKACSFQQLQNNLADKADELQRVQNNILSAKDEYVRAQRLNRYAVEGLVGDKYQEAVEKNNANWESLLTHYQSGIDAIRTSATNAGKFASQYYGQSETKAAEETKNRPGRF